MNEPKLSEDDLRMVEICLTGIAANLRCVGVPGVGATPVEASIQLADKALALFAEPEPEADKPDDQVRRLAGTIRKAITCATATGDQLKEMARNGLRQMLLREATPSNLMITEMYGDIQKANADMSQPPTIRAMAMFAAVGFLQTLESMRDAGDFEALVEEWIRTGKWRE